MPSARKNRPVRACSNLAVVPECLPAQVLRSASGHLNVRQGNWAAIRTKEGGAVKRNFAAALWPTVVLLAALVSQPLYADSPALNNLKIHITALQQVLGDPKLADPQHLLQRRKLARVVLQQLFDFQEMSRRSLGANARRYNDRLGEFTPLFIDFLEQAYMRKLEDNGDAKIQYIREIVDDTNVEVETKTKLKDGSEYSVSYKLYLSPAGWRAYDVVVEGVSLVNNYRSQFDRFLGKKSFDELLQELRDKKSKFS
jgi:phospholipid transport system substrate-binding protein